MNPFIEFYRAPVDTLTALAYILTLATLLVATLATCWKNALNLKVRWTKRQLGNVYNEQWQYDPPIDWLLRLAAIPAILAVDAWALAALFWMLS